MTTVDKSIKDQGTQEQEYKLLEWGEPQFIAHVKTIVPTFASDKRHIQKICLDSGDNVYLVPEILQAGNDCNRREQAKQRG